MSIIPYEIWEKIAFCKIPNALGIFNILARAIPKLGRKTLNNKAFQKQVVSHFNLYEFKEWGKYIKINEKYHSVYDRVSYIRYSNHQNGSKVWYNYGKLHRIYGPAYISQSGTKIWYQYGEKHRIDGPAHIYLNKSKAWYYKGKMHREDGPALICDGGKTNRYYLYGTCVSAETYKRIFVQNKVFQITDLRNLIIQTLDLPSLIALKKTCKLFWESISMKLLKTRVLEGIDFRDFDKIKKYVEWKMNADFAYELLEPYIWNTQLMFKFNDIECYTKHFGIMTDDKEVVRFKNEIFRSSISNIDLSQTSKSVEFHACKNIYNNNLTFRMFETICEVYVEKHIFDIYVTIEIKKI